jgi:hypothetical protein
VLSLHSQLSPALSGLFAARHTLRYWKVISDRKIIHRGLAPTRAQARVQAIKVVASLIGVRQSEDSTPPFEGLKVIEGS